MLTASEAGNDGRFRNLTVLFILISFFPFAREIMLSGGDEFDLVLCNLSALEDEPVR
jgi:hypothetical protein